MQVDLDGDLAVTVGITILSALVTLYSRTMHADSKLLRAEVEALEEKVMGELSRNNASHEEMWTELKTHRDIIFQNKEAALKLTASIERLNEILPKIEQRVNDMQGSGRGRAQVIPARRANDPPDAVVVFD